eukprot:TRINITY_DN4334_c0_g1_i2.p1 TRINITY_DN4334_c0_g1~~TRINITY_DN4334_c0_g1_i2.p1  ORF type:complete len:1064 (-),score=239.19 TRINITY_DN4334_c0_g1_i2:6-3197(-)
MAEHAHETLLEDHELSQDQAGRVVDLFLAHSPSDSMDRSSFSSFLLEAFAYSLFSHEAFADSCTRVRQWQDQGLLTEGIDMDNQVIRRTFEYFDIERCGALGLRHVMDGIEKIGVGTFGTVARFLFFVTDSNDRKSIGREDLESYFHAFSSMFLRLSINIAQLETEHLLTLGVEEGLVLSHIRDLQSQLDALPQTVASETEEVFREMRPCGQRVSYSEWLGGREFLPKIYRNMLALCDGLVFYDDRGIRPTFSKASADLVDPVCKVTLTSEEAQRIVDMFLAHTSSNKMQASEFRHFLLEGFAHAFFSVEAFDYSCAHVRDWIADGSLSMDLDLGSPLFERTFRFFDVDHTGVLDLQKVGSGIARMTSGSLEDFARYLFFLTDVEDRNNLSQTEILAFFRHFIRFFSQLSINLLELERSHLVNHHSVDRRLMDAHSTQHQRTLQRVEALAAESTAEALESIEQGDDACTRRISFHKWLNLRGALPKLYNRMRTVCVAMVSRDAPHGFRPSFSTTEGPKERSLPSPIVIPTDADVAGIAMSPASPSRPSPSRPHPAVHTKLQAASNDARVSPCQPKSPIQKKFLEELREELHGSSPGGAGFATPPNHRPPHLDTTRHNGDQPPLSPLQRSVLRGVDHDVDLRSRTGLSIREVALTPTVLKNLDAIERLEQSLADSPVRKSPMLRSPSRDVTNAIRHLASPGAARGNPALCSVDDTLSASNTNEVASLELRLNLEIDFDSQVLTGSVEIEMVKQDPSCSQVWLDVMRLMVHSAGLVVEGNQLVPLEFSVVPVGVLPNGSSVLQIQLPEETSDNFCLRVEYSTTGADPMLVDVNPSLVWVPQDLSVDGSPCVYSCGGACSARGLFPCQDTPSAKMPFSATITVPQGLTVLMSANLESTQTQVAGGLPSCTFAFEMLSPLASHQIVLFVGVLDSAFIGTRSRVWAAPEKLAAAVQKFNGLMDDVLEGLSMHYGDHEWGQQDIVVAPLSFAHMALAVPCLTLVSPTLDLGSATLPFLDAMASLWFGALVTAATWSDHWLCTALSRSAARRVMRDVLGVNAPELSLIHI